MRLLIVNPFARRRGGAENMLWSLLRHLDGCRTEAAVLFTRPGPFEREVAALGVRTLLVQVSRIRQLSHCARSIASLARVLRAEQPDLVLSWMPQVHVHVAPAAMLAGLAGRLVWFQHYLPNRRHWLDRSLPLLPARAVGCCSESVAQAMLWPRRPTFVVHPGIEPRQSRTEQERASARRALGLPEGRPVIGIVGRLEPLKRQDLFLRVLAVLVRRGHDVHGLVVGGEADGTASGYREHLRGTAARLGLRGNVTFTGHVEDATLQMQAMDALVNVSTQEGFSLALVEAMALGLPVAAFANGGPTEIVEPGVSGLLVPADDEGMLADQLDALLRHGELRERLGRGGFRCQRQRFTAAAMAESFQWHLEDLWRSGRPALGAI